MTRPGSDDTGTGTGGDALATYKTLRSPSESRFIEVLPRSNGGAWVVVKHLMDGWSLWSSPVAMPTNDTVLRQVAYTKHRDILFDGVI